MIYLYLPEGLSICRYVQVLPLNMVCFIAIKRMNTEKEGRSLGTPQTPAGGLRPPAPPAQQLHEYKEWLVYTKLTILIVNFAVKRERGACCLTSSEWGIIYST